MCPIATLPPPACHFVNARAPLQFPRALAILPTTPLPMLRSHRQPVWRATAISLSAALLLAPVTPAQALATRGVTTPPESPSAGDENIPDEPPEPGQLPAQDKSKAKPGKSGETPRSTFSIQRKGSAEQGHEISDQADAAFDAENYGEAARLYTRALDLLSENESNHIARSVVLANGVTSYEQVYAQTRDLDHLRTAQRLLQDYLRICKTKHGTGCDRYPETQEARSRLQSVMATIDTAAPRRARIPPEIGAAPGGKQFSNDVALPDAPGWIAPAIAGGILLAGGGSALAYYAATADKYGPIYQRDLEFRDTADTTTGDTGDTTTDGADTSGTTSTVTAVSFSPETKGKLLIGVGAFIAAAGVGFAVLGAMALSKHRRLNRQRRSALAVTPTFGRGAAGLALSGRF